MVRHDTLSGIQEGLELGKIFIQQSAESAFLDMGIAKDPYPAQLEIFNSNHMIRALFGANQCLSVNSEILMAKGFSKPLRDMETGEWVIGFDFNTRDFLPVQVNGVYFNETMFVHSFQHSEGILRCSKSHKVCAVYPNGKMGMIRVMRAVKGQFPVIVRDSNGCPVLSRLELLEPFDEGSPEITMDLGVDHPSHVFVANGIVVSNSGKSLSGAVQMAWDATGLYPDWYKGERTVRGINAWVMGDTTENTREACQKKLFGPDPDQPGWTDRPGDEALIAKKYIIGKPTRKSVSGAFDIARVKHVPSDTISILGFKSHEMATQTLASWSGDRVWIDEECSKEILDEMIARITATRGKILITMCPVQGMTPLVKFLQNGPADLVKLARLPYSQAKHIDEKVKEANIRLWSSNPAVLAARTEGLATTNSGLIFPFGTREITYNPAQVIISPHWKYLGGEDVGYRHPTAAVALAWDSLADVVYAYATYAQAERPFGYHHAQLQSWGNGNMTFMIDPASDQVNQADGTRILEELWKLAHGKDYLEIPEEKRKYIKADNTFYTGMDAMWTRFASKRLLINQNLRALLEQYESYAWNKDGTGPKVETPEMPYDLITSLRYGVLGLDKYAHRVDQPPPWQEGEEIESALDIKDWTPFRAGREPNNQLPGGENVKF